MIYQVDVGDEELARFVGRGIGSPLGEDLLEVTSRQVEELRARPMLSFGYVGGFDGRIWLYSETSMYLVHTLQDRARWVANERKRLLLAEERLRDHAVRSVCSGVPVPAVAQDLGTSNSHVLFWMTLAGWESRAVTHPAGREILEWYPMSGEKTAA